MALVAPEGVVCAERDRQSNGGRGTTYIFTHAHTYISNYLIDDARLALRSNTYIPTLPT